MKKTKQKLSKKTFKFSINQEIFSKLPDYKVGVLVITGLKQIEDSKIFKSNVLRASKKIKESDQNDPRLEEWRNAYKSFELNPEKTKPSHISLFDRAVSGHVNSVLPLVDLLNIISLEKLIPIGAHDLKNLSNSIHVGLTTKNSLYTPMRSTEQESVEENFPAYLDNNQVLTKNFIWRQGATSASSKETTDIFIPIDTLGAISEQQLLKIMDEVSNRIVDTFGGTVQQAIISPSQPSFEFDTTNVANLPEVLTRGVAEILPSSQTLADLMNKKKIRLYLGIDPTGSLLTLGHSVVLRKLQQFADLGHEVILLIGNGTVRIGDPTGKDSTRPELTDEQIKENFKTWKQQASKVLNFGDPDLNTKATDKSSQASDSDLDTKNNPKKGVIKIKYNGDWLDKLNMAQIIKLMAKTTVQQLMERDMFQKRLEENRPIHGHEIMYPLLQGYDSVAMDVDLEIGGTDQTFNMMMGRTLQKSYNNHEKWVLTTPIINGTDGRKMSKSYGNFIALTEAPNDMYGKLMSVADEMIVQYFTLLTDVPLEEIAEMEKAMETPENDGGANPMTFKKRLAFTITEMYHDTEAAEAAEENFKNTVQNKGIPSDIPEVEVSGETLKLTDLVKTCMPDESNSNVRRLIEQRAVSIDGKKMTDVNEDVTLKSGSVLKTGKRSFYKIKLG